MTNTSIDTFVSIDCIIVHISKSVDCCGWFCNIIVRGGMSVFLVCRISVGIWIVVGGGIIQMRLIGYFVVEDGCFVVEGYGCVIGGYDFVIDNW